ncbi:MAG TPA: hypothetical protein VGU46_00635 [Acidobacteriaceae bacterium]|nr:hypothetical protein [Acidobacteriaceae bacterium]
MRVPRWLVFLVLLFLAVVGFAHLDADFPNHSRWIDDAAKFTDEGWWASSAIRHTLNGHWIAPHDYNPGVVLPLWPVLLSVLFHLTGISAIAARALAFSFTIGTVLVCGAVMAKRDPSLRWPTMLLIASSPSLYFFSRLSILEPALVFFLVATAWAAYSKQAPAVLRLLLCGVLYTLAMLTKTSAVFLLPAFAILLWLPQRALWGMGATQRRRALLALLIPATTFAVCYGIYWLKVIHTHPIEVGIFYKGAGGGLRLESARKAVRVVYRCFTWVDAIAYPATVLALIALARRSRIPWQDPLFSFAILFFLGQSAFMVVRFTAEPHYFAVLSVPLMMIALLLLEPLKLAIPRAHAAMAAALLLTAVVNLFYIAKLEAHPEYSLRDACRAIQQRIASEPDASPLVIGHGSIETSLFTGLAALDDLGNESMDDKLRTEHPGWVVSWNNEAMAFQDPAVQRDFVFEPQGRFPALDGSVRNALLLYRIRPR